MPLVARRALSPRASVVHAADVVIQREHVVENIAEARVATELRDRSRSDAVGARSNM